MKNLKGFSLNQFGEKLNLPSVDAHFGEAQKKEETQQMGRKELVSG